MSIFVLRESEPIQVCRAPTAYLRSDGSFGTSEDISSAIIAIHNLPGHCYVKVLNRGVAYGDALVMQGTDIAIDGVLELRIQKTRLKVFCTGQFEETLARSAIEGIAAIKESAERAVRLTVAAAGKHYDFTVPFGAEFRLGSSTQDALSIPYSDALKSHCSVRIDVDALNNSVIVIAPLTGSVKGTNKSHVLYRDEVVALSAETSIFTVCKNSPLPRCTDSATTTYT